METPEAILRLERLMLRKVPTDNDLTYVFEKEDHAALMMAIAALNHSQSTTKELPTDKDILEEFGRYQYESIRNLEGVDPSALREECVAYYWGFKAGMKCSVFPSKIVG